MPTERRGPRGASRGKRGESARAPRGGPASGTKQAPAHPRTRRRPGGGNPPAGGRASGRADPGQGADQALFDLLAALLRFEQAADRVMQGFFKATPAAGRRDRQRLADHAYAVIRSRRLYAHLAEGGPGRLERRLALLAQADGSVPEWIEPNSGEQAWLERVARIDRRTLPWAVRFSLPDWLADRLNRLLPEPAEAERFGQALLRPAGLDLRVNTLKAQPEQVRRALLAAGVVVENELPAGLRHLPTLLRVRGRPNLAALPAFEQGWFEVQDAGSQWVVHAAGPRRGQTVVDLCAGAGGKTLALAAAMRSRGQIYACDISARRLQSMRPRLARSGATNVQPMRIESEHDARLARLRGRADLVLVDAPCGGSGTLRRNPDLKWRYGEEELARLGEQQRSILAAAADLVAPGGRLIYATCSLLPEENEAVVRDTEAGWLGAGRDFMRLSIGLGADGRGAVDAEPAGPFPLSSEPAAGTFLRLWPHRHDCDGFFAAAWQRP